MSHDDSDARERVERHRMEVAASPASAAAHLNLGTSLLKLGLMAEAEAALRRALELAPELPEAQVNLGGILLSRWDFRGCVELNARAAATRPGFLQAHYNQGLGHLYLGEAEAMVGCFRRVLELEPDHAGGHYHLAVGLLALGDAAGAQHHCDVSVALGHTPQPDFLKALEKARGGSVPVMEIG
ncbi:MAG: tetratricopeptide repeat protein [Acidobacteriota bacterium]